MTRATAPFVRPEPCKLRNSRSVSNFTFLANITVNAWKCYMRGGGAHFFLRNGCTQWYKLRTLPCLFLYYTNALPRIFHKTATYGLYVLVFKL